MDAGLLTIIGYPAFAASTTELCDTTRTEVISKLEVCLCASISIEVSLNGQRKAYKNVEHLVVGLE